MLLVASPAGVEPWWALPVVAGSFLLVGALIGAFTTHLLTLRTELIKSRRDESRELNSEGRAVARSALVAAERFRSAVASGDDTDIVLGQLQEEIAAARMTCSSRVSASAQSLGDLAGIVERERRRPGADLSKVLADFVSARTEMEYTVRVVMRLDRSD